MRYQTAPIKQATQHGIHDTPDSIKIQPDYKQYRNHKVTWILKNNKDSTTKIIKIEDFETAYIYLI